MKIRKIISGGQTGADRGGLLAARACNIPIGGWVPRGGRAEDGKIAADLMAHLRETASAGYLTRTGMNVRDADGTLIVSFGMLLTGGSRRTQELADQMGKPWLHAPIFDASTSIDDAGARHVVGWICRHEIQTLNVAGPRESKEPGIQSATRRAVSQVLKMLEGVHHAPDPEAVHRCRCGFEATDLAGVDQHIARMLG